MNLDDLTLEIRPRRPWEAVDLGLHMARRWWWPMTKAWLAVSLPLFLLLNLLPVDWLWLSYLIIWWLKPVLERPLLHILSQAVFGQLPSTTDTLRAFLRLAGRQMFLSLTWRRLSPTRSMDLPVIQLEGLRGQRRQERLALLHREDAAPAPWLTIIGVHIEGFLSFGLLMLLYALVPAEIPIDWLSLLVSQETHWFLLLTNSTNFIAMTLMVPFYVACGFSLYLNRRIKLEAWDIDIAFRRIVNKRRNHSLDKTLAVFFVMIFSLPQAPQVQAETDTPRWAQDEQVRPYTRETAKAGIEDVLSGPDFHQKRKVTYPRFVMDEEPKESPLWDRAVEKLTDLFDLLKHVAGVASLLEILLWTAVICGIFFLAFRYRHWLASYLPHRPPRESPSTRPVTLFGLDLTPESLPANIGAAALNLWQNQQHRLALALLYRACLSRLLQAGVAVEDGYTEEECLQVATRFAADHSGAGPAVSYFSDLTRHWQRLAYGHLLPPAEDAEALCRAWNPIWDDQEAPGAAHD